ncbi:hypothetical protein [Pantoea sp. 9140]|uniref:hypothetical protein n=1 Tax=Pantoea sp. 9140 TaxID=1500896 RepID=UPI0005349CB4|nr:hypothetical protein [Pantoea sp. 9140]
MTNEEKQEIARQLKNSIADLTSYLKIIPSPADSEDISWRIKVESLALVSLTAHPVKHPHEWVHIRFTDRSKSQRMKCQIAWSDSLNSVIYDEEGAPLLIANSGYEVQE